MPDEKPPIAENEAQETPLTQEEYAAQLQRLNERVRAAGLKPLETMVQSYGRRFMAGLESFVAALEGDDSSKKKKE